jgi:hypothetical protein
MQFWHLVFRADSLTYTIGRALRECGHEVAVWVVDPEFGTRAQDGIQRRLAATAGVRLLGRDAAALPERIERLVIQVFPRPFDALRDVPVLAPRAERITLVTAGDRSRRWAEALRLQRAELGCLGRDWRRVDRVLYKDGAYRADRYTLRRPRAAVGFDTHSQFLHEPRLFDLMHAQDWEPETRRPLLANFIGSRDPTQRGAILDTVRDLFVQPSGEPRRPRPGKSMFWHEYPDANPVGLGAEAFVDALGRSDFTLCPRGWSLVTHRPVEALLRGSIPVLAREETDLYGFDLADGVNCIAVPRGQWPEAIARLTTLSEAAITRMRGNIRSMCRGALEYPAMSARISARVGASAPVAAPDKAGGLSRPGIPAT